MKKFILFISLTVFLSTLSFSVKSKDTFYNEILKIYKYVNQISFNFELVEESYKGNIVAKKGNKYKLEIGDREILCNGETVWNYSKSENRVYISDFEERADQLSLDKIFFSFIDSFKPIGLSEVSLSNGIKAYSLVLKTDEKFEATQHISTVEVWVHKENYDIIRFQVNEPQKLTWMISNLKLRKKSKDDIFNFNIPEDCTVIDLR